MSRIFIDGFESGTSAPDLWDSDVDATVISSAGLDMDGSYCLDLNAGGEYIQKSITADDEMYFAFLYRPITNSAKGILTVYDDSTVLLGVRRNTSSTLLEAYGSTYLLLETGTHGTIAGTTYLVEVRIKIADSGGRVEIKVNGVQDVDFTGDTKLTASTQFNSVWLGYGHTGLAPYAYFDNFIMDDAGWIGDTKIQAVVPTGAGTTAGWTPSVGANWSCVDEKPANDADYVEINAIDTLDTYAAGDMAGTVGTVKCVQVQARVETDGSPTPTNLKLAVRSGGVDYVSVNKAISATAKSVYSLWETDPYDSAAWTEADVNAMEVGMKSAA